MPTSLAGGVTHSLLGKNFWNIGIWESLLLGIFVLIGIFILIFLCYGVKEFGKYIHNIYVDSIWGNAIIELKNAYSEIHFLRKKDEINDEEFIQVMIIFCDTIKRIFDKKTKTNCCVSIKVAILNGDNVSFENTINSIELKNLCRDSRHGDRDTKKYQSIKHGLFANTAYNIIANKIVKENQRHLAYVNNDILNSKDYMNTSKECYTDGKLPYNSELVYPIIPIKTDKSTKNDLKILKGFICIDSESSNAFDEERYDIPMIEGVADGIYDIFEKYDSSINRNSQKYGNIT